METGFSEIMALFFAMQQSAEFMLLGQHVDGKRWATMTKLASFIL